MLQGAAALLFAALAFAFRPLLAEEPLPEPEVKAALLVKLVRFVIFPEAGFNSPSAPLLIGVLGPHSFEGYLDRAAAGKFLDSHPLKIRYATTPAELEGCQVVFVARARRSGGNDPLRSFDKRPVLLVGEEEGFANKGRGGMINLLIRDSKPYLQINARTAEKAGLRFRGQLAQTRNIEWVERPTAEPR